MVLLKKEDREEEFYFAPTKKKAAKGSKKKDDGAKAKTIKHDAGTFQLFSKLKLDAPLTTDEVPDLITKLEEQLEDYHKKVKNWEVNREAMKAKILSGEDVEEEKKEEKE